MSVSSPSDPEVIPTVEDLTITNRVVSNVLLDREDVESFLEDIQETLLFRIEWQVLLSPGLQSLVPMGECFLGVYATSNPALPLSVPGLP